MARKQSRLKFKPTPISRLFKYKMPMKMVGDPEYPRVNKTMVWRYRSEAVYEEHMALKRGGWTDGVWHQAHRDNEALDKLLARKWDDYDRAMGDLWLEDYEAAQRDNATWDYEHDNFVIAA